MTARVAAMFMDHVRPADPSRDAQPDAMLLRVLDLLETVRETAELTATQTDVLVASVFGETRDDLRERLAISDATLRKHVSSTLQKAGAIGLQVSSLDRLISHLYVHAAMSSLDTE